MLISLRKHIDEYWDAGQETERAEDSRHETYRPELPASDVSDEAMAEFRAMLIAIGRCGERAVPGLGGSLNQKMGSLEIGLIDPVPPGAVTKTGREAQSELSEWAELAHSHYRDLEQEVREILHVLSNATGSLGEHDAKYANELGDLTARLGSIATGHDLTAMRRSIVESTRAIKACLGRMSQESKTIVGSLTAEIVDYRSRFEEAERIAMTDSLTDLANRRAFEKDIESRIRAAKEFSLILIDLDNFKSVNDNHGHPAGDDLLRQFAVELKSQFITGDLVARFGGDEFAVVTSGGIADALWKVDRIQKWTLGEYKVPRGTDLARVRIAASIGVGEWEFPESSLDLIARVDKEVYKIKSSHLRATPA